MKAFLGKQSVKDKYVGRLRHSREIDRLTQGTTGDGVKENGCFISCTMGKYSHTDFEKKLGVPLALAHIMENIFESMSAKDAAEWAEKPLAAVRVGADLSLVAAKMNLYSARLVLEALPESVKPAQAVLVALHEREAMGDTPTNQEFAEAFKNLRDLADLAYRADRAHRAYLADRADRADRAYRAYLADRADRADRAYLAYLADRAYLAYLAYLADRAYLAYLADRAKKDGAYLLTLLEAA